MTLSERRRQMAKQKQANNTKGEDSASDFEYRRDVLNDIEEILMRSDLLSLSSPTSPEEEGDGDTPEINPALVRRLSEDIVLYIMG
jgi:hypothetical protein